MNIRCTTIFFCAVSLCATVTHAGNKNDKNTAKRIRSDIEYLASDELEGRRTGTRGEAKATAFIEQRYKDLGIKGYKGKYRYPFHFVYGKEIAPTTHIRINNINLVLKDEAFPLPSSGTNTAVANVVRDVREPSKIWMIPLFKDEEQANDPHFEWEKQANEKAREAQSLGATAVILYDAFNSKNEPSYNAHSDFDPISIPVVVVTGKGYKKALANTTDGKPVPVDISTNIIKADRTGINLAAYIDNKAKYTVIIGAHYDHLGYGEDGNSLHANAAKEHQIHHGADDNASGTAAVLEEARWIKDNDKLKNFNYLFLNFSGEELGLYGSKAFVKEQKIDSSTIAYMINIDMIGRLNDSTHALTLGGVGTSPTWASVVDMAGSDFKIVIDSSGAGPSDHTSFYNAGIPVLFFFTGTHKDYHKPTDIAEHINAEGEVKVLNYINDVLVKMDEENQKPSYQVTKIASVGAVKFKVTLGIMPDYSYQDGGVRVDGVSENRPAAKAGILTGDIIIQLGPHKVQTMQSYMEALGKFTKGDKTTVKIMRNGKEMEMPIELTGK